MLLQMALYCVSIILPRGKAFLLLSDGSIVCPSFGLEEQPSGCFRWRALHCCCSAGLTAVALHHIAMNKAKQQGDEDVCTDQLKPHHPVGLPICMCGCACQKHVRVCVSEARVGVRSMCGCQKHVRVCVSEAWCNNK